MTTTASASAVLLAAALGLGACRATSPGEIAPPANAPSPAAIGEPVPTETTLADEGSDPAPAKDLSIDVDLSALDRELDQIDKALTEIDLKDIEGDLP